MSAISRRAIVVAALLGLTLACGSATLAAPAAVPAKITAGCQSSMADAKALRKQAGEFTSWWDRNQLSRAMGVTYLNGIQVRTAKLKGELSDATNLDLASSIRRILTDGMNNARNISEARTTQQWAVSRADHLLDRLRQGTC